MSSAISSAETEDQGVRKEPQMQASGFQCTKARQGCELTKNYSYTKKASKNNSGQTQFFS